ncbi:hypothetical protein WMO25_09085 [Coprococcus sp. CLA-AA-H190]|uniref:Uncharacterized protein n=1 Tax=Coprococcus intestinihominis TaxID=3133154 RepID=A0ABV1B6Z0_9FIRM
MTTHTIHTFCICSTQFIIFTVRFFKGKGKKQGVYKQCKEAYGSCSKADHPSDSVLTLPPQKQKFHEQRYNHKNRTHCKKFLKNNILLSNAIDIIYKIQEKSKTPQNNLPHLSTPDFVSN